MRDTCCTRLVGRGLGTAAAGAASWRWDWTSGAGQAMLRTAVAGGRSIRCGMSNSAEEAERSVAPCTLAFVPNDLHGNAESQLNSGI